jgi:hypothetical protein
MQFDTVEWTFDCIPLNVNGTINSFQYNDLFTNDSICNDRDDDMDSSSAKGSIIGGNVDGMDSSSINGSNCSGNVDEMDSGSVDSNSSSSSDGDTMFDFSVDEAVENTPNVTQLSGAIGNHIAHYPSLVSVIESLDGQCPCCKKDDMEEFFLFCEEKIKEIQEQLDTKRNRLNFVHRSINVRDWYREWNDKQRQRHSLTIEETTYGLATNISIKCDRCKAKMASVEAAKLKECHKAKSDICQYEIKVLFSFALQLMGIGGEHGCILTAFLNLPDPTKWNHQFNILESYTYDAIQKVKNVSDEEAAVEEVAETVRDEENEIQQNILEQQPPLHHITASSNMGWQVRLSGGKYGSSTGHGLLIGALSKKVLDSIIITKNAALVPSILPKRVITKM